MKLAGFAIYRYSLPVTAPLILKGIKLDRREGMLLELTGEDGTTGWGEASPLPGFSRETLAEAGRELRQLTASMMGREVTVDRVELEGEFVRALNLLAPAPSVRFGFELAVWNLCAAARNVSLAGLISPRPREEVPVNALASGPPSEAVEKARRIRAEGYTTVKLKVGGRPVEEDARLVRALAGVLGEKVALRLDANRAWSFEEAVEFARRVTDLRIEYVEEPLADPSLLSRFADEFDIPVALDESLAGMDPESLGEHYYASAVVLKPTLLGGISPTLRLARRAVSHGMTPVISSVYETGVGTMALVALAAAIGEEEVPTGLDTYRWLAGDVVRPRLELPATRVDVRRMLESPRALDPGLPHAVG